MDFAIVKFPCDWCSFSHDIHQFIWIHDIRYFLLLLFAYLQIICFYYFQLEIFLLVNSSSQKAVLFTRLAVRYFISVCNSPWCNASTFTHEFSDAEKLHSKYSRRRKNIQNLEWIRTRSVCAQSVLGFTWMHKMQQQIYQFLLFEMKSIVQLQANYLESIVKCRNIDQMVSMQMNERHK